MNHPTSDAIRAVLDEAVTATGARPSQSWEKAIRTLLADTDPDPMRQRLLAELAEFSGPDAIARLAEERDEAGYRFYGTMSPDRADTMRGQAWMLAFLPVHPDTTRALAGLVESMLRKVPGIGPLSPKVANAGVYALSRIDSPDALAQLARLSSRVTFKGTLKMIDTALDTKATAMGITREEVEELAVPDYGLTSVGAAIREFGPAAAELLVEGRQAKLSWRNDAGKTVKSPPASVKRDFGEELKELKATAKDITKMLTAQLERLDRQFLADRQWEFKAWRERYLDHPLVGTLARRLLWLVDGRACGFADGALRDLTNAEITTTATSTVRLWHPVGHDTENVLAWRDWLESHRIMQPFKQAHREVYLLTEAEENTGTYSNRFAAHVIKQHQFHALAAIRGWHDKLRLMVDDSVPPPMKLLPQYGLRAEFWVEGAGSEFGTDTTDSGSFLWLSTDQLRFYPIDAPTLYSHCYGGGFYTRRGQEVPDGIPLSQVPPLVLSEVMRDVVLFIGVGSVGNDPTWSDGGPQGRYRNYWQTYSFGDLSATAQTRRQLLERLVPRLGIADRATVEERFLVVRGDIRTYKIHLGSGNILMAPNDQYLCIVPSQAKATGSADTFLPFEGDGTLAVILSKAFLLAADTKITDTTITSQISRTQ